MDLTRRPGRLDKPAAPFDSFYHRRTPRWHDRRAVPIAVGSAIAFGCVILSSTLAMLG